MEVSCTECAFTGSRDDLLLHFESVHYITDPKCEHCGIEFDDVLLMMRHSVTHLRQVTYCCTQCDFRSLMLQAMPRHKLHAHSNPMLFRCADCGDEFGSYELFSVHAEIHRGVKLSSTLDKYETYQCRICGTMFNDLDSHIQHGQTHTENTIKCNICSKSFVTNRELILHSNRAHNSTHGYKCPECNQPYDTMSDLSRHRNAIHNEPLYTCNCGYASNTQTQLSYHRRRHCTEVAADGEIAHIECDICGESFGTQKQLQRHKREECDAEVIKVDVADGSDESPRKTYKWGPF